MKRLGSGGGTLARESGRCGEAGRAGLSALKERDGWRAWIGTPIFVICSSISMQSEGVPVWREGCDDGLTGDGRAASFATSAVSVYAAAGFAGTVAGTMAVLVSDGAGGAAVDGTIADSVEDDGGVGNL